MVPEVKIHIILAFDSRNKEYLFVCSCQGRVVIVGDKVCLWCWSRLGSFRHWSWWEDFDSWTCCCNFTCYTTCRYIIQWLSWQISFILLSFTLSICSIYFQSFLSVFAFISIISMCPVFLGFLSNAFAGYVSFLSKPFVVDLKKISCM